MTRASNTLYLWAGRDSKLRAVEHNNTHGQCISNQYIERHSKESVGCRLNQHIKCNFNLVDDTSAKEPAERCLNRNSKGEFKDIREVERQLYVHGKHGA